MKPITKGSGDEIFTLYVPLHVNDDVVLDIHILIKHLNELINNACVESVEGRGMSILKFSGITSYDRADKLFQQVKRTFSYLIIECDTSIQIEDSLSNASQKSMSFHASWQEAIDAGWSGDKETASIKTDGIADITSPVIVSEQKKIVDWGGCVGRIQKPIKYELLPKAIEYSKDETPANDQQGELALQAYINAISTGNILLRILSLVTCLEILAECKEKSEKHKEMVKKAIKAIKNIECLNEEDIKIRESIISRVGVLKKQSIKESLDSIIDTNKTCISTSLPIDHPYKNNLCDAVRNMYKLRSEIAHKASLGKYDQKEVSRLYQFTRCAAKVLLKKKLNFV
ncbi:hypothetical protein [Candidatus Uabimicrobium sp. HlEnr_7]|uniref:hypothetical protein n=1 Tax=Candidatus Uabimicrobium helgolandensis TaxID=3095367 RepID=UPI00355679D6